MVVENFWTVSCGCSLICPSDYKAFIETPYALNIVLNSGNSMVKRGNITLPLRGVTIANGMASNMDYLERLLCHCLNVNLHLLN